MSELKPLTVLLGSGFAEGCDLPGTAALTNTVKALRFPMINPARPNDLEVTVPAGVWRMATSYYANPNFETVLHLVETVMGYERVRGWLAADDRSKAAFGAFTNIMPHWRYFIEEGARYSFADFYGHAMTAIAQELTKATDSNLTHIKTVACPFINAMIERFQVTVATLNYDDILERCFEPWHDGFNAGGEGNAFDPRVFLADHTEPTLMHLHGSVRFYALPEQGGPPTIFKAESADLKLPQTRNVVWVQYSQSGETLLNGPMITGLRKTDKTITPPFGFYQYELQRACYESPRLLVIGFGAYDTYISSLLVQMRRIHGDDLRAVFVTKCDDTGLGNWAVGLAAAVLGAPENENLFTALYASRLKPQPVRMKHGLLYSRGFPLPEGALDEALAFLAE